jgi:hypothetical protein
MKSIYFIGAAGPVGSDAVTDFALGKVFASCAMFCCHCRRSPPEGRQIQRAETRMGSDKKWVAPLRRTI